MTNITTFFANQTSHFQQNTTHITMQCFEWCKQQHLTYTQQGINDIIFGLNLGLLMIVTSYIHPIYKRTVMNKLQLSEATFYRVVNDLHLLGIIIMTAMLIYYTTTT